MVCTNWQVHDFKERYWKTEPLRAQINICVCFRCSCPCKWMFLFIRAATFSRDPLCLDIPFRQLSFDLTDIAMLFSVCFSNSLAPTKMNRLV